MEKGALETVAVAKMFAVTGAVQQEAVEPGIVAVFAVADNRGFVPSVAKAAA